MVDLETLKEYIQAFLGYEDEARQLKEAKKDWRNSFMERTGISKAELKMIDGAVKVNMKMDTEFEINMFVENVQKVSDYFNKKAPGKESESDNPLFDSVEKESAHKEEKKEPSTWNPPPAPVIPVTNKKN